MTTITITNLQFITYIKKFNRFKDHILLVTHLLKNCTSNYDKNISTSAHIYFWFLLLIIIFYEYNIF